LYNLITIGAALAILFIAKKFKAKLIHCIALCLASLTMFLLTTVSSKVGLSISMIGLGIGWASMMGVPYLIVSGSIPRERFGVYMGIINMLIVIPMLIYTITFGPIFKNLLHNNGSLAIKLVGILLLIAGLLTLLLKEKRIEGETVLLSGGGH
jgi:maltose/moltooligosaccharide transporter